MDDDYFKMVRHRRNRTVGIPVIISAMESRKNLRQVNPAALYSAMKSAIDAASVRSYFTAQGFQHAWPLKNKSMCCSNRENE